jgi:meiotically up-regulated gene 157 (Mug157) protein
MFAVVALNQLAEILSAVSSDKLLAADCRELAQQVGEAVNIYGKNGSNYFMSGWIWKSTFHG